MPGLQYLEIILRSVIVYLIIIFGIRIFGKREISQLSVFDLVFILLISNAVQNAMVGPDNSLLGGLIAAGSLFAINKIIGTLTYRSPKISKLLEGEPIMLVYDGKILTDHLKKTELSEEEVLQAVREHGVPALKDVNLAILETDGNISILSNEYKHKTTHRRRAHKVVEKNA